MVGFTSYIESDLYFYRFALGETLAKNAYTQKRILSDSLRVTLPCTLYKLC